MAKSKQGKKHSFSFFSIFKSKKVRREEAMWDDSVKAYKVYPSDQDGVRWVSEPGIDKKASAFINSRTSLWSNLDISN
ncbi:hypothetical protein HanRHA438_Chr06g0278011 [Helianthus annuus]|uniref:Uncharacterized protein n=1 Tax=Helianthus annuus TaxID=4232 RepID=A0A9K3IUW3_HELAN|nr:hypothetical protein HanXRQr2_Chr06g0268741 [Helianthus annuus]KAJ0561212.1 hypothetical protein HanHA300_Chr06g0220311 [Helianthus annuus]KAJ0567809.1 hypothetical protein HanIR_Chr06g0289071 [Helianthus annuus]KAJ0574266.1 hypothetical protein HanHA89_Chr06g0236211 [Helianthus annuus]KAJ0738601.1 hypothetical protein HanLR1_Chr06g0220141 [Helianthus annuus]